MIHECFWWYITLARQRPLEATVIAAVAVFIFGAWLYDAIFDQPEDKDGTARKD